MRTWRERTERGAPRRDARTHVWRVAADASSPARQLTFGERGDSQPAWSPDGRYISFLSARGPEGDDEPKAQVWVMRSDGGEAWALTETAENVLQYAWSPDAKTIAFTMTDPREDAAATAVRARDDEKVFEADYRRIHLWVVDLATRTRSAGHPGEGLHHLRERCRGRPTTFTSPLPPASPRCCATAGATSSWPTPGRKR